MNETDTDYVEYRCPIWRQAFLMWRKAGIHKWIFIAKEYSISIPIVSSRNVANVATRRFWLHNAGLMHTQTYTEHYLCFFGVPYFDAGFFLSLSQINQNWVQELALARLWYHFHRVLNETRFELKTFWSRVESSSLSTRPDFHPIDPYFYVRIMIFFFKENVCLVQKKEVQKTNEEEAREEILPRCRDLDSYFRQSSFLSPSTLAFVQIKVRKRDRFFCREEKTVDSIFTTILRAAFSYESFFAKLFCTYSLCS